MASIREDAAMKEGELYSDVQKESNKTSKKGGSSRFKFRTVEVKKPSLELEDEEVGDIMG
jgi:hypothetical protein